MFSEEETGRRQLEGEGEGEREDEADDVAELGSLGSRTAGEGGRSFILLLADLFVAGEGSGERGGVSEGDSTKSISDESSPGPPSVVGAGKGNGRREIKESFGLLLRGPEEVLGMLAKAS